MTLDDIRAAHPELGFAVYAYEPKGPVTFEIHAPDGRTYSWTAQTVDEAISNAFPPAASPSIDVFD